ncbi:MAG: Wzz/FepE/Etk N-terminal domain-containing protein [Woeseiaceae bacterium]
MNSNSIQDVNNIYEDEIDLKELFLVLWDAKKLIILVTSLFAMGSIIYSLTLPNYYRSEAVVSIAGQLTNKSSLGGLSGLASMAGISLSADGGDKSIIAIKTIQSRSFLKHLISFEGVLPSIVAAKSYDFQSKKIQYDPKIYNEDKGEWVRKAKRNRQAKPSYLEIYSSYLDQVSVTTDKVTNLVTISVEHISPIFAKELLVLIIDEANELMRDRDLRESSDAIAFLNTEIPKSSLITMKEAINNLVQAQLEKQMLSKINTEYILKVIEPPFIPEEKSRPLRAVICIFGTLIGGILAIIVVFIRNYSSRRPETKKE